MWHWLLFLYKICVWVLYWLHTLGSTHTMSFIKLAKSALEFWKPSVGRRLTVYFTIFGLIISYVAVTIFVMGMTRDYLAGTASFLREQNLAIRDKMGADYIWRIRNTRHGDIAAVYRLLFKLSSKTFNIERANIYCWNTDTRKWYRLWIDESDYFRVEEMKQTAPPKEEDCRRGHVRLSYPYLWGGKETIGASIRLNAPGDRYYYALQIDVKRQGIIDSIIRHIAPFVAFNLTIVILSHLLGHLFAARIANPVQALSEGAARIAGGEFGYRFKLKRNDELGQLSSALNRMAGRIERYIDNINEKMHTLQTMNRIDKAVLSSISRKELLDRVLGIVASYLPDYQLGLVVRDEERKGFEVLSYHGAAPMSQLSKNIFIDDAHLDELILSRHREVFQLHDCERHDEIPPLYHSVLGEEIGSILNIPIEIGDKYLGSFLVARKDTRPFAESEIGTIQILSDQTGVALQSVRLFEDRERLFMGILTALSRSIDAKSRWTAGHSERVASYSERIGRSLSLSVEEMRTLSIASLLHDIGKIGVPEYILDKPARLSDEEFAAIKIHPAKGAEIIGDIPYYETIKNGILYHHERWDGSGYPSGLANESIPLHARIIAVADVYDAITDDRPYRKGMTRSRAEEFFIENKGAMFDPLLVDVFLEILRNSA